MKNLLAHVLAALTGASLLVASTNLGNAQDQTNALQPSDMTDTNFALNQTTNEAKSKKVHGASQNNNTPFGIPADQLVGLSADQIRALRGDGGEHQLVPLAALFIPVAFFAAVVLVVAIVISMRLKKNRLLHETLRAMIEKGTQIPPELLHPKQAGRHWRSDLRTGLILIAVGLGLEIAFYHLSKVTRGLGLIPLLMGVAFLITWKLEANKNGDSK